MRIIITVDNDDNYTEHIHCSSNMLNWSAEEIAEKVSDILTEIREE